jgi:hypothetical protein
MRRRPHWAIEPSDPGPRAGTRITVLGAQIEADDSVVRVSPRCAVVSGVSPHANVRIPAKARRQLENLRRYAARPPVATERLSLLADGRVLYHLRHHWRDGTTHVAFEPLELVARLAALVPPPRFNLVRYLGVLAPAARWRAQVVPDRAVEETDAASHPGCAASSKILRPAAEGGQERSPRPRNYTWAQLMRRVFAQ